MTAHGQRREILLRSVLTEPIEDDVGATAAARLPRLRCEGIASGHDRMLAAVGPRELGLGFARHGANDAGAKRLGPLAEEQPDAPGRRVHQDGVAGLDTVRAMQKVFGGHTLQHERGCSFLAHVVREQNEPVRRQGAHGHVRAGRRTGVRDPVAGSESGSLAFEDDAGRFHADRGGGLDHPVESLANVDVDVVDADRRLSHADLSALRRRRVEPAHLQHFGAPEGRGHHAL